MIPIRDQRGRVIGFGGRILGAGEPKYLNSPETVLFDKGRTLYNIDRAGPASRQAKRLIVVEGYMDVIGLDRAGIAEVGRAQRHSGHGIAAGADVAARMGSRSAASTATRPGRRQRSGRRSRALPHLAPERTLRFVALPAGQDPDDLVNLAREFHQVVGSWPAGSATNRSVRSGASWGRARIAARTAAFCPAASPSKQQIGCPSSRHIPPVAIP